MPGARRSVATATRPVAGAATLINDPFTGTNGAAPSTLYWGTPAKSTGSTVDINNNQLRMLGGTLGTYTDYQHLSSLSSASDFDYNIDVVIASSTTEHFPQVGFRGSGIQETQVTEQTEQTTGYFVDFDVLGNLLILRRRTAGANITLGSVTIDWADNDVAHLRITPSGSTIRVGCTRNAAAPPATYLITVTDATYTSGKFWLGHAGGADTTPDTVAFDNAVVTIPSSNVTGTFARTLSALTLVGSGTYGSGMSFAAYKASVIAEMIGFGTTGSVTGGQAASAVTVVSNTNDSGAGSLRAALTGGSTRWIVFDRAAFPRGSEQTIALNGTIDMRSINNITIDAFGATVKVINYGITTATWTGVSPWTSQVSNNLVFMNLKMGPTVSGNYDCLTIDGTDRFWLYHLEAAGAGDGNIDITLVGSGPNAQGYGTMQNCHVHDANGDGKNCLIGDQSEGYGDERSTTSGYPAEGGDLKLTICNSRFAGRLRNPVIFNTHCDFFNNYTHGYEFEGPALFGGMCAMWADGNIVDGTGAGANASKGIYSERYGYTDTARDYRRQAFGTRVANLLLGGATELDASGGFSNPAGSIFTIPYSATIATATTGLRDTIASSSESTQGRAGRVDRNGYYDLVTGA